MKKTFLIALLCCGFAMADTVTPDVKLSFDNPTNHLTNTGSSSGYTIGTKNESSSKTVTYDGSMDCFSNESGYAFESNNKSFITISGSALNLNKSFTLSFVALKMDGTQPWANLFGIDLAAENTTDVNLFNLQDGSGDGTALYAAGSAISGSWLKPNGSESKDGLSTEYYTRLTLVYTAGADSTSKGSFTLYVGDNSYTYASTRNSTDTALVLNVGGAMFYEKNQTGQANAVAAWIDDVAVYSSALNADAVAALDAPTKTIPEPATATLSLLALAGLAARRRRK